MQITPSLKNSNHKDSLITKALEILDKKINLDSYIIKTHQNFVSFFIPVKYLPLNTAFHFDIGVDVKEQTVTYNYHSNQESLKKSNENILFYQLKKEYCDKIQFVIKATNNSKQLAPLSLNVKEFKDEMIIKEQNNYFEVSLISSHLDIWYKIDKKTGAFYDLGHAEIIPPPIEEE